MNQAFTRVSKGNRPCLRRIRIPTAIQHRQFENSRLPNPLSQITPKRVHSSKSPKTLEKKTKPREKQKVQFLIKLRWKFRELLIGSRLRFPRFVFSLSRRILKVGQRPNAAYPI